jgi:hypothetical protein
MRVVEQEYIYQDATDKINPPTLQVAQQIIALCKKYKVDIRNLTTEQARQVFARDHLRDIAEQRAWLAQQSRKAKTVNVTPTNYRIKNGTVEFLLGNGKLRVTRAELLRIAAEMDE